MESQNTIVGRVLGEAVEAVSRDQRRLVAEFVERGSGVPDQFVVEFDAGHVARAAAVAEQRCQPARSSAELENVIAGAGCQGGQ